MLKRFKNAVPLVILAALVVAAAFAIHWFRHQWVSSDAEMVALLPGGDNTVFFADFSLLRQAGILKWLTGTETAQEAAYRTFVQQTGFDYTRDTDALAGEVDGAQFYFVARGRFSWGRLRKYALEHGGSCQGNVCAMPSVTPGRWISFLPIQGDVIALAVGPDRAAVLQLSPRRDRSVPPIPPEPVWVRVSHQSLEHPENLPVAARIFLISLTPAQQVVVSLAPNQGADVPYKLRLVAECDTPAKADVVYGQLETQTKVIRAELLREHKPISRGDLAGLFASGMFHEQGNRVTGEWPIYRELLEGLQR